MHISQYFLRGDVRGAIAHMRAHEEVDDLRHVAFHVIGEPIQSHPTL